VGVPGTARDCADVQRGPGKGLRDARQLTLFVGYKHREFIHPPRSLRIETCIDEAATKDLLRGGGAHLGNQPRTIPREEDGLPNVGQVEQFLDESVEAEAPAAMGRHAVSEGLQVEIEVLDV